ncbi:MAG: DUF432 domain-containing protein [Thermoplasmata archaeon]|nr:MAG: DUF432 domain-containing protein [Thermoplasmata archaeon]
MFGFHAVPSKIENEDILITVEKKGDNLIYKREFSGETIEKILLTKSNKIHVNPIEPLHKPRELTPYLLIKPENPIVIEPKVKRIIYLKFPIEIGIFISGLEEFKVLDILTLVKQKFTLYGEVRGGIICKFWESEVYDSVPSINPHKEGVIELTINNTTGRWHEITQPVFNAYGMKIYYGNKTVSMRATMKIYTGGIGETEFFDSPIYKGMSKSLELYTARKIPVVSTKFIMEWGL